MNGTERPDDGALGRRPNVTGPAIVDPRELFKSQLTILKRVLLGIYEFAEVESRNELTIKGYRARQRERHPHQVFLIAGARASGKTSLLLTIQHHLRYLGRPGNWGVHPRDGTETPPAGWFADAKRHS